MWIPLRYNLRNLRVRALTTLATALGIALTVGVFVAVMALVEGIRATFVDTGSPQNVLVLRRGAQTETGSILDAENVARLRTLGKIESFSAERIIFFNHTRTSGGASNVVLRGVGAAGRELRPEVVLLGGRWFEPGRREVTVSRSVAARFTGLALGDRLVTGNVAWSVVGIFDAGRTAYASEIWTDASDIGSAFQRFNYSAVLMRAESRAAAGALVSTIDGDPRLEANAWLEPDYFAEQTKSATPIRIIGNLVALIMAIGSTFAGMNTMYAAVAHRQREIAVIRALGFSRSSVIASFLIEAAIVSLLGGIIGGFLSLPINGIATGTTNWFSFTDMSFAFRITPALLARGLLFAIVIGVIGGILPAIRASALSPRDAMRAL